MINFHIRQSTQRKLLCRSLFLALSLACLLPSSLALSLSGCRALPPLRCLPSRPHPHARSPSRPTHARARNEPAPEPPPPEQRAKAGGRNLRALLQDITLLQRRLAVYRPGLADAAPPARQGQAPSRASG